MSSEIAFSDVHFHGRTDGQYAWIEIKNNCYGITQKTFDYYRPKCTNSKELVECIEELAYCIIVEDKIENGEYFTADFTPLTPQEYKIKFG